MGKRPEHQAPPEIFYNETEAKKYSSNSHMIDIQQELSKRAIEMLNLPDGPCHILDVGCGSGLSGECLTEQDHIWVGMDISKAMLDVAKEREVEGDVILADMGQGVPFRPGSFDGVISISALQWLCNSDKSSHKPEKRILKFFTMLYSAMARGARAVFQLYPENDEQLELLSEQARMAGFFADIVIDYPNSAQRKKLFLFLNSGGVAQEPPKGLRKEKHGIRNSNVHAQMHGKEPKKSRNWILEKKERSRRQGKEVRRDSKYTGRKRPMKL